MISAARNIGAAENNALCRLRHPATFLCAAQANFCTILAMVHRMLAAFVTARMANVRAELTDFLGKFTAACHVGRRHATLVRNPYLAQCSAPSSLHHALVGRQMHNGRKW